MGIRLLPCAAVFLLALTCIPAEAQVPAPMFMLENVKPPAGLLQPDGTPLPLRLTWRYSPQGPMAATTWTPDEATIHWVLSCEAPSLLLNGPQTSEITFAPGESPYTGEVAFTLAAGTGTPGLRLLGCELSGKVDKTTTQAESNVDRISFQVAVDYEGAVAAQVADRVAEAAPEAPLVYRVHVVSLGNAQGNLHLELVGLPDGWSATAPEPVVLDSGAETDLDVVVHSPSGALWTNSEQPFVLRAWTVATLDSEKLSHATTVDLLARSRGIDATSPSGGLAILALAGLGAGAVLLVRRRRGRGPPQSPSGPSGP